MSFDPPIHHNEHSARAVQAQKTLAGHNRFAKNWHPGPLDGIWGKQAQAAADECRFELGYPTRLCSTGVFGQTLFDYVRSDGQHKLLPKRYQRRRLQRRGKRLLHQHKQENLPNRVWFPNAYYAPASGRWGLQPWIVPQVEAILKKYPGLVVTSGHGGHPPHAQFSDHAWGGAVDLAGPYAQMVAVTLWADKLKSGFYRKGKVFRWVGGPAHDADGVEAGHYNHAHLSWYRFGPATSVFGTPGF